MSLPVEQRVCTLLLMLVFNSNQSLGALLLVQWFNI